MRKSPSGSPTAWKERRKAYRKAQGPVSNPGQPSSVNRKARRKPLWKLALEAQELRDKAFDATEFYHQAMKEPSDES